MTGKSAEKEKGARARVTGAGHKDSSINVVLSPGSTDADFAVAIARTLTRPETTAASVIETWQKDTHDVNRLAAELHSQIEAVNRGELQRAEGLLIAQAHALDNIFANLARRATNQEYLKQWEVYMRMAMKAQNQCRMTLETLAAIKNPPIVYARQANINNAGQQQVNIGSSCAASGHPSRVRESETERNELLEITDEQRLDARTACAASRVSRGLEAVDTIDRTANRGRQGNCLSERLQGRHAHGSKSADEGTK